MKDLYMPYWLQFTLFVILSGLVQYLISYFKEKGKNLATKEDIKDITQKVEEVKNIYSSSLEKYKVDLQKEFESHKYIQTLCHELDKELLSLVSVCLNAHVSRTIDENMNDNKLVSNTCKLSNFLNTYKSRYKSCSIIKDLTTISSKISVGADAGGLDFYDENNDPHYKLTNKERELLIRLLNQTISLFLPALNINQKQ